MLYPGQLANVHEVLELASEYRKAVVMLGERPRGKAISRIPRRFLALHAIELYLNAFLLAKGVDRETIRGLQHDMGERSRRAMDAGLVLRKRTVAHLATLSDNREYLVTRYGPEMAASLSQINRVTATLEELAHKVRTIVTAEKS